MSQNAQERSLMHGRKSGPCAVCSKRDSMPCSRCRNDFYCGKEHQKLDWPRHKQGCGVVAVRSDAVLGRYLEATKDIPAGTVVMRELPLVVFPKPDDEGCCTSCECEQAARPQVAVCVGCGRLPEGRPSACELCGWPVCGEACGRRAEHRAECAAFQRAGYKLPDGKLSHERYEALATLRVCLAMGTPEGSRLLDLQSELPKPYPDSKPPERADMVEDISWIQWGISFLLELVQWVVKWFMILSGAQALDPNKGQRPADPDVCHGHDYFEQRSRSVVGWLRKEVGMTWLDPNDLRRAKGTIHVNCFTLGERDWLSCLLAWMSLLEHACVPNMEISASGAVVEGSVDHDDMEHVLFAVKDIKRGEHLTLSYRPDTFLTKGFRRRRIATSWGFNCRCWLCEDPMQCWLHLDSWYCGYCKGRGLPLLVRVDDGKTWHCEGCGRGGEVDDPTSDVGLAQALALEQRLLRLQAEDGDDQEVPWSRWKALLEDALWPRGPLHPTSSLVLRAKESSTKGPANSKTFDILAAQFPRESRETVTSYLRDLLRAMDNLQYGTHSRERYIYQSRLVEHMCMLLNEERKASSTNTVRAQHGRRLRVQRQQKQRVSQLQQDIESLLHSMEKAAVTPFFKDRVSEEWQIYRDLCDEN